MKNYIVSVTGLIREVLISGSTLKSAPIVRRKHVSTSAPWITFLSKMGRWFSNGRIVLSAGPVVSPATGGPWNGIILTDRMASPIATVEKSWWITLFQN